METEQTKLERDPYDPHAFDSDPKYYNCRHCGGPFDSKLHDINAIRMFNELRAIKTLLQNLLARYDEGRINK